jgi:putative aldouronate transport system permease protein
LLAVRELTQTILVKKSGWRSAIYKKIARHWQLYILIALPTAFLITFNYVPMFGAQIAFKNYSSVKGIWHSPWVGLEHFTSFFKSPYFWPILKNTLTISFYVLLVSTPMPIILALCLNEVIHERFKRIVQMITYAPYFISTVVLIGMMQIILSPTTGLLKQITDFLGLGSPPDWLGSPSAFPSLYVWSGIWQETGYGAVIYLAALSNVNPELYEAAKLDGASRWNKMMHIDLPSIRPTIIVLFILAIGGILGVGFEKTFLLQNSLNLSSSEIIATYVYKIGLLNANYSFAVAVGLFNSVIGFILMITMNFIARKVSDSSLF